MKKSVLYLFFFAFILSCNTDKEPVNPCQGLCQNGSACVRGMCQCLPDYEGRYCETLTKGFVTLLNKAQTPLLLTIGLQTIALDPEKSFTVEDRIGTTIAYKGETSGKTNTGSQVGLKLVWDSDFIIENQPRTINLNVGSEFFYLKINNTTDYTLRTLHVNYGLASQTLDNIEFTKGNFGIGYYRGFSNSNVRIQIKELPGYIYFWEQGKNFTITTALNQVVEVTAI